MQITDVRTIFVDCYLFVEVDTDAGITGLGESGAWGFLEASASAVETFKRYLIGQDPLRIEHHWQYLYRWSHFRGAAVMGALSALTSPCGTSPASISACPPTSFWAARCATRHASTITSSVKQRRN